MSTKCHKIKASNEISIEVREDEKEWKLGLPTESLKVLDTRGFSGLVSQRTSLSCRNAR